jgi:hypothetical protein
MKIKSGFFFVFVFLSISYTVIDAQKNVSSIPHLVNKSGAFHLVVDNKPFLILGGELGNSSFTSMEYMKPIWLKLKKMNLNTVLAPVYWELIEQVEGKFNFDLYDMLIKEARTNKIKLVFLWFGSWKNSMSSHVPAWIKKDAVRFPRAKDEKGKSQEILTSFSEENLKADLNAFQALMKHIEEFDKNNYTVIMMQLENEIGMLPSARDYHSLANKKFQENVPSELMSYLIKNKDTLVPEFKDVWAKNGFKETGNWEEIFGKGTHTDEIFMAWYFSKFTNAVTEAGKAIYPLPMYVNAALNRPGVFPGAYPSAGPLPHLMDIWKAGGTAIDFLAPDIYFPNIKHWSDLFTRQNNPLFIPETALDKTAAAKTAFVLGHYKSLGFSPFSIESVNDPENEALGKIYKMVGQLTPIITANQVENRIEGVLFDKENKENVFQFGDYEFTVKHSNTLGYDADAKNDIWETTGALIIQTGQNEFYLLGFGVVITFKNIKHPELNVGILKVDDGKYENGRWKVIRHLNGDQIHQGRHVRALLNEYLIQRFELYNYD